jgi:hypothetical protein
VRPHFDLRGTHLSCRAIWMCLDQGPSWRQRGWPQPVDQMKYLGEQFPRHRDLGQLERDVPAMADNFGPNLDQLLAQRSDRPMLGILGPY